MPDSVHVKGMSALEQFLEQLEPKLVKNVCRGAARAAANVIKPVAQSNINKVSGALARSLKVRTEARGGMPRAMVYTRVFYAPFVEYGTKPHRIAGAKGRGLAIGGKIVAGVDHPGAQPKPFLRPALDTQAAAAVVAAGNYMKKRLADKHGLDTSDITIEEDE